MIDLFHGYRCSLIYASVADKIFRHLPTKLVKGRGLLKLLVNETKKNPILFKAITETATQIHLKMLLFYHIAVKQLNKGVSFVG